MLAQATMRIPGYQALEQFPVEFPVADGASESVEAASKFLVYSLSVSDFRA